MSEARFPDGRHPRPGTRRRHRRPGEWHLPGDAAGETEATFDFNGDGVPDETPWIAPGDAFLFLDLDGDGLVSGAPEIAFAWQEGAAPGSSDLEAIRQLHDSDGDGVLTAADALWSQFGLWTDLNSDGVSQAGEVSSLEDAGITGIGLESDGQSYRAANGEVTVLGEAEFVRADGTMGLVGDVMLAYQPGNAAGMFLDLDLDLSLDLADAVGAPATPALPAASELLADEAIELDLELAGTADLAAAPGIPDTAPAPEPEFLAPSAPEIPEPAPVDVV